jgi:hypothetical protein
MILRTLIIIIKPINIVLIVWSLGCLHDIGTEGIVTEIPVHRRRCRRSYCTVLLHTTQRQFSYDVYEISLPAAEIWVVLSRTVGFFWDTT